MATLEQLSAEQRAIIELVLERGKRYDELADMLGIPEPRVRELARDALVELAPVSAKGVEEDWRGQLADYLLGQQAGPEATATRGHLRRSEGARSWARSLLDSLDGLYEDGSMPVVPDGERGARARAPSRPPADGAGANVAADAIKRRRVALTAALAAVALAALLLWPIGLLRGDDEEGPAAAPAQSAPRDAAGIAVILGQRATRAVNIQANGLEPSTGDFAYEVWLYNSAGDARSLGSQVAEENGRFRASGTLPEGFADYRFIDISREPIDQQRAHSGRSVLRGAMPRRFDRPSGNRVSVLGTVVLAPPGA